MKFKEIENQNSNEEKLNIIEDNYLTAREMRNGIRYHESLHHQDSKKNVSQTPDHEVINTKSRTAVDSYYKELVDFYVGKYRRLEIGFKEEDLLAILPDKSVYRYSDILKKLISESIKEIQELNEMFKDEIFDKDSYEELKKHTVHEKRKINVIKNIMTQKEEISIDEQEIEKNQIFFAPTKSGKIRIISELEDISPEYYPVLSELLVSIIDGTFKGIGKFNSGQISGLLEVTAPGQGAKIIFKRISKNIYVVISAFVGRSMKESGYRDSIRTKIADYKIISDKLKAKCEDQEFIELNEQYLSEVFNILGYNQKNPQLKKEKK